VDPDLSLALELADRADRLSLAAFGGELRVERKADGSPVTAADREVEQELRVRLAATRPRDAVVGEEYGAAAGGERRWFLDPIDGTRNFVRGIPVWATLVGLEVQGVMRVGVVSAPALRRRWWAVRGGGAFTSGPGRGGAQPVAAGALWRPLRVSAVDDLGGAQLSYDSVPGFAVRGLEQRFLSLARRCARSRGFGDFWGHVLVAEGCVEVAVEPEVSPWDLAPLLVIVEEAGGRFTDLEGRPRIDGGSAVSTNGRLHETVLAALR
jgi:histidinol-phosphatase